MRALRPGHAARLPSAAFVKATALRLGWRSVCRGRCHFQNLLVFGHAMRFYGYVRPALTLFCEGRIVVVPGQPTPVESLGEVK